MSFPRPLPICTRFKHRTPPLVTAWRCPKDGEKLLRDLSAAIRQHIATIDVILGLEQHTPGWLVSWLGGWLVGWLPGWLLGWLVDWLVGWLVAEYFEVVTFWLWYVVVTSGGAHGSYPAGSVITMAWCINPDLHKRSTLRAAQPTDWPVMSTSKRRTPGETRVPSVHISMEMLIEWNIYSKQNTRNPWNRRQNKYPIRPNIWFDQLNWRQSLHLGKCLQLETLRLYRLNEHQQPSTMTTNGY